MLKKPKKIEILLAVYEELIVKMSALNDQTLSKILAGWRLSLDQIQEFIESKKGKPSLLYSGLEQGLYDCLGVFSSINKDNRGSAYKILFDTVESHIPGFFDRYRTRVDEIVRSGMIGSENEWHMVRCRIDELEEKGELEKSKILDSFLLEYERRGV